MAQAPPGKLIRLIAAIALLVSLAATGWWIWRRGGFGSLSDSAREFVESRRKALAGERGGGSVAEASQDAEANPENGELRALKEAVVAVGDGDLLKARDMLRALLLNRAAAPHLPSIKALLGEVNLTLLLNPGEGPGKQPYVVQGGDAIAKIATRTGAPAELIVRSNNLQGLVIRKGETLHIPSIDAAVVIYLRYSALQIFDGEEFLKEYPIRAMRLPPGAKFPLETTVSEKISTSNTERVAFGDPAYFDAARTITLKAAGFNIYAPGSDNNVTLAPGGTGFQLDAADLDEIFLLVKRGTPVQIIAE